MKFFEKKRKDIQTSEFKILFGLVSVKINYDNGNETIRFLGIPFIKGKSYYGKKIYFLDLKFPVFFNYSKNLDIAKYKHLFEVLKESFVDFNYDSVFCFNGAPSGELYIVLNLLNRIIELNSLKKPLLVVNKKWKYDLCKLYQPNMDCICFDKLNLFFDKVKSYKQDNCIFYSIFTTKHYLDQDILINTKKEHYYNYICSNLGIDNNNKFQLPEISNNVKSNIKSYIEKNNLNNFVIVCPEANTCNNIQKTFWIHLCDELKKLNLNVYLNITDAANMLGNCCSSRFSHEEMIELAKYAKGIIGIRSGFLEILSLCRVPIFSIYLPFDKRGVLKPMKAENVLSGFTLKNLPNVDKDNIFEFNFDDYSNDELLVKKIIDSIKNKNGLT